MKEERAKDEDKSESCSAGAAEAESRIRASYQTAQQFAPYQHQHPPLVQNSYGYHLVDPQWVAHVQQMQQQHDYRPYLQYGYHHYTQFHMEGVPLPPGIPGLGGSTDPLEAVLGPFPCARLSHLPYDATLEDILVLFQGLVVIDVVLIGGVDAFVIFANPMDFQMALQRNRQTIGRRFIDIAAASRSDYYEAVATIHEQERGSTLSSGLRGDGGMSGRGGSRDDQPAGDTASTVAALWGHQPQAPSPPMQGLSAQSGYGDPMGIHGGMASMSLSGRGPTNRDPGRGVMHAPVAKRTGGGIQVGEHTGFLRMRGLPFSAAKDDIYKFFGGYNPIQDSIVLTYRNDGRATGEAYIGFATAEDAERAMALHRRSMGSRYIELFISNKDEQGRALNRFGGR